MSVVITENAKFFFFINSEFICGKQRLACSQILQIEDSGTSVNYRIVFLKALS